MLGMEMGWNRVITETHDNEATALEAARRRWCSWVLFQAQEAGASTSTPGFESWCEVGRGGLGFGHRTIRNHVAAIPTSAPATDAPGSNQIDELRLRERAVQDPALAQPLKEAVQRLEALAAAVKVEDLSSAEHQPSQGAAAPSAAAACPLVDDASGARHAAPAAAADDAAAMPVEGVAAEEVKSASATAMGSSVPSMEPVAVSEATLAAAPQLTTAAAPTSPAVERTVGPDAPATATSLRDRFGAALVKEVSEAACLAALVEVTQGCLDDRSGADELVDALVRILGEQPPSDAEMVRLRELQARRRPAATRRCPAVLLARCVHRRVYAHARAHARDHARMRTRTRHTRIAQGDHRGAAPARAQERCDAGLEGYAVASIWLAALVVRTERCIRARSTLTACVLSMDETQRAALLQGGERLISEGSGTISELLELARGICRTVERISRDLDFQEASVRTAKAVSAGVSVVGSALVFTPFTPMGVAMLAGGASIGVTTATGDLIGSHVQKSTLSKELKELNECEQRINLQLRSLIALCFPAISPDEIAAASSPLSFARNLPDEIAGALLAVGGATARTAVGLASRVGYVVSMQALSVAGAVISSGKTPFPTFLLSCFHTFTLSYFHTFLLSHFLLSYFTRSPTAALTLPSPQVETPLLLRA